MIPYNKKLTENARQLRCNMTNEERRIWYDFLVRLPYTVRRQHNIENYIVDFYVAEKKIVIEIDGLQHSEPENAEKDKKRDEDLAKWGITVLRYPNYAIRRNFNGVTDHIMAKLDLDWSQLKPIKDRKRK